MRRETASSSAINTFTPNLRAPESALRRQTLPLPASSRLGLWALPDRTRLASFAALDLKLSPDAVAYIFGKFARRLEGSGGLDYLGQIRLTHVRWKARE